MIKKFFDNNESVNDFLPSVLEIIESPPSPLGKAIIRIISFFVTSILIWACVAKIDKVIVTSGQVMPIGGIKVVESNINGKITNINKNEGDVIEAEEAIMELDNVNNEEKEAKIKEDLQLKKLEFEIINSKLENRGIKYENFNISEDKLEEIKLSEKIDVEKEYKKINDYNQILKEIDENILTVEKETKELNIKYSNMNEVDKFISGKDILSQIDRNKKQTESLSKTKSDTISRNALEKSELVLAKKIEMNRKAQEIVELEKNIENIIEQKNNYTIKSPISGTIFKMNYNTVGSYINQIKPIAEIVPIDVEYEVEAVILNKDISKILVGQSVVIKVESYDYQKYGTLKGDIRTVSPNSIIDEKRGLVYKVKIAFNQNENPEIKVLPGMNAILEIKSEKIRVIDYFLEPFKKHVDNALKG